MIKEAIILAGGLGTRLRSIIPDLPKCMAPIGEVPFLEFIIKQLEMAGIERIIYAVGYKAYHIEEYIANRKNAVSSSFISEEKEPLGTGGAIKLALRHATQPDVLIVNGDTFFDADIQKAGEFFRKMNASCGVFIKPMPDASRYGLVETDDNNKIVAFKEKKLGSAGLINAGIYWLNVSHFNDLKLPDCFSFETDYLQKAYHLFLVYGYVSNGYFIDIGIPDDYARADREFPHLFDVHK